jgi:hypothetical protein
MTILVTGPGPYIVNIGTDKDITNMSIYNWTYRFNYIGLGTGYGDRYRHADISIYNWTHRFYYIGTEIAKTDMSNYKWIYWHEYIGSFVWSIGYMGTYIVKTDIIKKR